MNYTIDEVMRYIEEEDAKFIRLAFPDAYGVQKNISVRQGELKKAFEEGIPVDAASVSGFRDAPGSVLYLRPDPATLSVLPWRPDSGKVLRMYCDLFTPDGEEYASDTRHILKNAVAEAGKEGISFRFGSEMEFYLFKKDDEGNPTKIPYDQAGYLDVAPEDRCENIRREISLTIERMGLVPERSHHERGPGQNEIDFHYGRPLKAADQMMTFKQVARTIADLYGLTADFSPMPLEGEAGNGFHIRIYAEDADGNDVVRYAAAGILQRLREITLFLNPTRDSYTRLGRYSAAQGNENGIPELLELRSYKENTHAELCSPDASGNPYLIYTLLIGAGLEGIREKKDLPDEKEGRNLQLPKSIEEAAAIAAGSEFVRRMIPQEILQEYQRSARGGDGCRS